MMNLLPHTIDLSWKQFLTPQIRQELIYIEGQINSNPKSYTPSKTIALRFLERSLSNVKIVILGRDPYPQPNVATGRSFEIANHYSWNKISNASLRNILKLIYCSLQDRQSNIPTMNKIRSDIKNNQFTIKPPNVWFDSLEKQGVLFLNTAFTCQIGSQKQSGSHQKYWNNFTDQLLKYIVKQNPSIQWILWGNYAQSFQKYFKQSNVYRSCHPSYSRGISEFIAQNSIRNTKNLINWLG